MQFGSDDSAEPRDRFAAYIDNKWKGDKSVAEYVDADTGSSDVAGSEFELI